MSTAKKHDLGISAARGVLWTGGGQVLKQVIQVASSIMLARLLVPQDFGLLGMAMVFVGVAQLFADFGVGAAIVQAQSSTDEVLSSAFWSNVLVAGVLMIAIMVGAPYIGRFWGSPEVATVLSVSAVVLLLASVQVVPQAILYRDMRFGEVAFSGLWGSLAGATAAVLLAWSGFGVWSLVAQPLVGSTVTIGLMFYFTSWVPRFAYSWSSVRDLVHFSGGLLGTSLLGYAQRNADSFLIGKFLGSGPLGYYQMAYQLMLYPLQQVSSVIVKVLFPTLSKIQDDLPRLRSGYLKAVAGIAVITFPMMMGLFAVAEDFVLAVFGEKWLGMLPLVKILSWIGLIQSVVTTVGIVMISVGKVRQLFLFSLTTTPLLIVALLVGVQWGVVGVAWAYAATMVVMCTATLFYVFSFIDLPMAAFLASVWRPFASGAIMLVSIMLLATQLAIPTVMLKLILEILFGVVVYILSSLVVNRAQILDIKETLRHALGKNK